MPLYCSQGHENDSLNRFCQQCGQQLPLAVGQILDKRYRLHRHLGQGGFGRTYLAEALHRFNEGCVLKEFAPQVQGAAELAKAKELFEREAGALHKLHHPQLPGFWELFQADMGGGVGCLFLVQDYVEGQTYFDLFKSGRQFSETEIIQFLRQMLPILAYIHSQGVIHRDVSPDNIILRNSDNLPVLIDFGGVKQIAATAVSQFSNIGTLPTRLGKKGYAPEEQLRQGKVFVNSDLYSLAVTALVLLTGKEPHHLYDTYKGAWRWGQEIKVSRELEAMLNKMLAHKPGDRFSTAHEVLQALLSQIPLAVPALIKASLSGMQTNAVSPQANLIPAPTPIPLKINQNPSPIAPNLSKISRMMTLVFAPKAKPAPIAVSPISNQLATPQINHPVIKKPSLFLSSLASWTLKFTVGTGLVLVTSWAGWAVMNSVIRSTNIGTLVKQLPNTPSHTSPNSAEAARTEKLLSRRQALGISEAAFYAQVNQKFYTKHPELNRRQLTAGQEDADLREEWYTIAENFLGTADERR